MDQIEDVYSNAVYSPFILYCQKHNYQTMFDLRRCSFDNLGKAPGITIGLLMRIKSLFSAYCKKHPDILMGRPTASKTKREPAPPPAIGVQLESYFRSRPGALLRVTDICKSLMLKRADVVKVLEEAPWCKAVDSTTFFYSPPPEVALEV